MTVPDEGDEETLLFNLAYCSRAGQELMTADIDDIVSRSRLKNASNHITGWLVYSGGIFFQWLEGARDPVTRLMTTIAADPRHRSVTVISEGEEIRERLFSAWDMELVSPEDIRDVLVDAISTAKGSKNVRALRTMLKELDAKGIA